MRFLEPSVSGVKFCNFRVWDTLVWKSLLWPSVATENDGILSDVVTTLNLAHDNA